MHDMMKRHEVQVLRRAGVSQEQVAKLTGVSVRSVRMIEAEAPVVVADDTAEREKRGIGRPSKAEPFRGLVAKLLAEDPELLSLEILRRARLDGYDGGKSALYALVKAGTAGRAVRRAFGASSRTTMSGVYPGPDGGSIADQICVTRRERNGGQPAGNCPSGLFFARIRNVQYVSVLQILSSSSTPVSSTARAKSG